MITAELLVLLKANFHLIRFFVDLLYNVCAKIKSLYVKQNMENQKLTYVTQLFVRLVLQRVHDKSK